jgi:hypothetical protein
VGRGVDVEQAARVRGPGQDLWCSGRSSRVAPIYQRSCLFSSRRHTATVIFLDLGRYPLTPGYWS